MFGPLNSKKKRDEFAVYDIETLTTLDKVFLVGFYDGKTHKIFESPPMAPEERAGAIAQFCEWYFDSTKRPPIYAHNGGNFDHIFILAWLLRHRPHAIIEIITTQSSILAMKIILHGQIYEFRDSFRLMPGSLDSLGKSLLGVGKIEVDYETLHLNPDRFAYLTRDLDVLYDSIKKFSSVIKERVGGVVSLTAASTAIKTLQNGYLKEEIQALPPDVDEFCRAGYYGGRCEVFRKRFKRTRGKTLNYYDVNSMYPWAMGLDMPTKLKLYTEKFRGNKHTLLKSAAFVKCGISMPRIRFPNLPYRKDGKLIFPCGEFSGVWTTPELRHAIKLGAKIRWIESAAVFRTTRPFTAFVNSMYSLRDKKRPDYDATLSLIAKILANSAYGKFGSKKEREVIHVRPPLEDIIEKGMRPLQGPKDLPLFVEDVQVEADYMLPQLSSWITALGRTKLAELIHEAEKSGADIYYCDTDSLVTTALFADSTGLGGLKTEYTDIETAHFVAPKVYEIEAGDKKIHKAKGFAQFGKGIGDLDFSSLAIGAPQPCSHFSKVRTFFRGDFGLICREKRLLFAGEKRVFSEDEFLESQPIYVRE